MSYYNALIDEKDKNIRILGRISVGLFFGLMLALWGWRNSAQDITLHYPPDLSVATTMKAGTVPKQSVYAFAPMILQQLNLWKTDGAVDYETNRHRLRQFLTVPYQRKIHDEILDGIQKGTLRGVTRTMQILPSSVYGDGSVQVVGNHWLVWVDVEVTDSVNDIPVSVNDRRLAIRVVRYDVDRVANPWQLAIDGIEKDIPLMSKREANQVKAKSDSKG